MPYAAEVLLDSVSPENNRVTTFEVTFPRIVLAEFNTHCMLSRNSASSRAVPVAKKISEVLHDPFVPAQFGRNQPGMSAETVLVGDQADEARRIWLRARDHAVEGCLKLLFGEQNFWSLARDGVALAEIVATLLDKSMKNERVLDVHKQIANRLLEPFLWHTVIVTATDWSNFFALRATAAAQPEIRTIALQLMNLYTSSQPQSVPAGGWHLPLLQSDERNDAQENPDQWLKISAARCARVSYLTHHGTRDVKEDLKLAHRLLDEGHMSPFEHVAQAMTEEQFSRSSYSGKLHGWIQYRKLIPNEDDFGLVLRDRSSEQSLIDRSLHLPTFDSALELIGR
jgi:hypothetical protein